MGQGQLFIMEKLTRRQRENGITNSHMPVCHPQHVTGQVFVCAAHGLMSLVFSLACPAGRCGLPERGLFGFLMLRLVPQRSETFEN